MRRLARNYAGRSARRQDPEFYKGRAHVYEAQKMWSEAVADWDKVLQLLGAKATDRLARREARKKKVTAITKWGGPREKQLLAEWETKFAGGDIESGYYLVEYSQAGKATKKALRSPRSRTPQRVPTTTTSRSHLVKTYRSRSASTIR